MIIKNIPKAFIGFLLASFLIWLLITFSKEYSTVLKYKVVFTDIPQNKTLENSDTYQLDFVAKGTGFKLLRSKIGSKTLKLNAQNIISSAANKHFVLVKRIKQNLQNRLISGVDLVEINKDTLFVNMGVLSTKKVPIEANLELNFHKGYDLLKDLELSPDSVVISGNKSDIDNLEVIKLKSLVLNDIKESFVKEVEIKLPDSLQNLKINSTKVKVSGAVDKFTEGKIEVPISIINLPKEAKLTTLSENVEITFVVALSNFTEVTTASFRVVCDYKITKLNTLDYLIPKVTQKPNAIKSYKISPHKIDFLIQK